jgi:hypothetical protein
VESDFRHFIVRASERGTSENGIPAFIPYPVIASAADEFSGATVRLMAPAAFPVGYDIPVVARVADANDHAVRANGTLTDSTIATAP